MFTKRTFRLFIGLILYALGIVFTMQANLWLSPWDALHSDLSLVIGITFGQVSILLAFGMGPIVQLTFKYFRFDVSRIRHDFFLQKQAS